MKVANSWLVGSMLLLLGLAGTAQAKYMDTPALIRRGNSLFSNGQYEEAARAYKQALKAEASADAAYNLALTYHHRLNYYSKALHYYQRFLELEPKAPEARQVKTWLREVRYKVFPEEVQKDPRFKRPSAQDLVMEAESDDLETRKGNEFLKQKNYRQAIQAYEQALLQKNSQAACFNLALLYDFELGYLQKAIFYYQKFLALAVHKPQTSQVAEGVLSLEMVAHLEKVTHGPQGKAAVWLAKAEATLKRKKGHFYQGTAFQLRQP